MTLRLIVRSEAEDDITEAAIWYESREVGLELEVIEEIHAAIERALESPLAYCVFGKTRMFVEPDPAVSLPRLLCSEIRRNRRICSSARGAS